MELAKESDVVKKFLAKCCISIVVLLCFAVSANAERKDLSAPESLTFEVENYLSKSYKNNLDKAKGVFQKLNDAKLSSHLAELASTARREKALASLNGLKGAINRYKGKDEALYKELLSVVEAIEKEVVSGTFIKFPEGASFKVDRANRQYILSWDNYEGQEVVKKTPFVGRMNLVLEASYVPMDRDGKEIMVYEYRIENRKGSESSFRELYLESKFPDSYVAGVMKNRYGRKVYTYKISKDRKLLVRAPVGYNKHIKLVHFDLAANLMTKYHPGEKMVDPYVLDEIEGALPGIVKAYVPLRDFNPHRFISSERDPEMAAEILAEKPGERTKYMYRGNTIGPVPVPDLFSADGFIDKIISYNEQAIVEGWNDRPPVIRFTKEGLSKIKADPGNKERINEFLSKLDGYYGKKQILSEAYALLKYNLEYLLSKI